MNIGKSIRLLGIGAAAIFALVVVALAALEFFISDAYVAGTVTRVAEKSLNAELAVKEVDFTAFSHFPHIGVKLTDGSVVSRTHLKDSVRYSRTPVQADSLISFKEFTLLFSPLKLLQGRIQIQGIILDSPRAYAYISPTGCANWDIMASDSTGVATEKETLDGGMPLKINIRNILVLNGGRFVFDNRADGLRASAAMREVKLSGNITDDLSRMRIRKGDFSRLSVALSQRANMSNIRFSIDTLNMEAGNGDRIAVEARTRTNLRIARESLAENVPLDIKGDIALGGRRERSVSLEQMEVSLAGIPIVLDGKINFSTGEYPSADISFNIPSSQISFKGRKEKIKEFLFKGNYHFRSNIPDSNLLAIERVLIDGDGIAVDASGHIKDLGGDPYINMKFDGHMNLDSVIKMLPQGTDIYGKGEMSAMIDLKSRLSNLSLYNLAKTGIKGEASARDVEFGIPSRDISCNIYGGEMRIGSWANTIDSAVARGTKMIGLHLKIDSTYIRYADSLVVRGKDLVLSGSNGASVFDTTAKVVHPFNGKLSAKRFELVGADSVSLRIRDSYGNFRILPYKGDPSVPALYLTSSSRMIALRQGLHFVSIHGGEFNVEANKNDAELKMREQRLARLTDSLQIIYPQIERDSLMRHWFRERGSTTNSRSSARIPDDFAQEDYNFRLTDKGLLHLLNRWNLQGKMAASAMRLSTPAFPLRTRAENASVSFNLNEVKIDEIKVKSGQSSFKANGNITGIRGALTRGSRIKARLGIEADTLNFNELAKAAYAGGEYMKGSGELLDSLQRIADAETLEEAVVLEESDTIGKMSLIIVPRNIEAELDMKVNYGIYSSITLNSASCIVQVKDRCLQITDLNANTSAGAMDLNAFYRTRSRTDLSVGFDMQLDDVDVAEFIKLYPGIDSLLPMIRSFEGIINSQMAATARIDTNMNFLLSTVEGVARIKGDSLVLMDGETFAEIAKMMKFKNRERNLVDSIEVEVSIKDNKIEVYPFLMKMDRYTTAISGRQDMEMNLDYHISVLKSPIPMRLGIDITGPLDDFKIKVGKARYKSTALPVYTKQIDSTRINLREQIRNIYK